MREGGPTFTIESLQRDTDTKKQTILYAWSNISRMIDFAFFSWCAQLKGVKWAYFMLLADYKVALWKIIEDKQVGRKE